tara:strand:+ start:534 stop:704 length:171 start_codon:yes stop_codon:yes gene_type:complete
MKHIGNLDPEHLDGFVGKGTTISSGSVFDDSSISATVLAHLSERDVLPPCRFVCFL